MIPDDANTGKDVCLRTREAPDPLLKQVRFKSGRIQIKYYTDDLTATTQSFKNRLTPF